MDLIHYLFQILYFTFTSTFVFIFCPWNSITLLLKEDLCYLLEVSYQTREQRKLFFTNRCTTIEIMAIYNYELWTTIPVKSQSTTTPLFLLQTITNLIYSIHFSGWLGCILRQIDNWSCSFWHHEAPLRSLQSFKYFCGSFWILLVISFSPGVRFIFGLGPA